MSATIAISNQKGGVAKTTTCLSLGAALAEMGHSVLLVDLDPQANLTVSLGIKPEDLRRTALDVFMGHSTLVGVSRESEIPYLDIVPANYELVLADKILYKSPGFQFRLRDAIQKLHPGMYDYVLLDCPPSLSPLTLNALSAADMVLIPVQCELYAAQSLRRMIRLATQMRQQYNPNLDYHVLVTMYDQRNKISQMILEQLLNGKGYGLFQTIIQIDTKLRESPVYGRPITAYASGSRSAEQYRALARELTSPEIDRLLHRKEAESSERNHV
jgi:chromosome partitioning protein